MHSVFLMEQMIIYASTLMFLLNCYGDCFDCLVEFKLVYLSGLSALLLCESGAFTRSYRG